ncbi:WD40 repeat-like protein [Amylostereum chailletii]|nr:WD40 repeat-like protein [Amylostereum chailletii]
MNINALHTLVTPAHVSSVSYSPSGIVAVGSDDGSLRLYLTSETKVHKAIRNLRSEVSSVVWTKPSPNETAGRVWVAIGRRVASFDLDIPKTILSMDDAIITLPIGEDENDVLNEIALNDNGKHLAFSTDSGTVGVVELSSQRVLRMKTKHTSISGNVGFIPDRPSELISGGYDSALLHFDFGQGSILSRRDFTAPLQTSGVSLSPPFILSLALSAAGAIAVGTADGQLWIGRGGEKRPSAKGKKKRTRKWEGLKEDEGLSVKIAEGPVVAVRFITPVKVLACSLLGTLSMHTLSEVGDDGAAFDITPLWKVESKTLAKVNAISTHDDRIAVGGFNKEGKGVVEVWQLNAERGESSTRD